MSADRLDEGGAVVAFNREITLTVSVQGLPPIALADEKSTLDAIEQAVTISGIWPSRSRPVASYNEDKSRWDVKFVFDPRPTDPASRDPKRSDPQTLGGGTLQLPPINFADGGGANEIRWDPIRVTLTTRLENPDNPSPAQLKGNPELEDLGRTAGRPLWKWIVLGLAGAMLVASLVVTAVLYFRWRSEQKAVTPSEAALGELNRLDALDLTQATGVERFHTALSDTVRRYLERQFRLRAPQQTTPEFLAAMQYWPQLPPPQQELLKTFLERCDMVKFAKVSQNPDECRATAEMARQIVAYTPLQSPDATAHPN
jgi:hypothetical protein